MKWAELTRKLTDHENDITYKTGTDGETKASGESFLINMPSGSSEQTLWTKVDTAKSALKFGEAKVVTTLTLVTN
ncbi:hypothetical protein [Vibrio variabilis]|uniref:hypothetical protein n=1 Tax=Vibrio variabilis TaxID=990271 RepID=UPI000DDBA9B1|nr:hypothetical protein [Vibrio variabilis]